MTARRRAHALNVHFGLLRRKLARCRLQAAAELREGKAHTHRALRHVLGEPYPRAVELASDVMDLIVPLFRVWSPLSAAYVTSFV